MHKQQQSGDQAELEKLFAECRKRPQQHLEHCHITDDVAYKFTGTVLFIEAQ